MSGEILIETGKTLGFEGLKALVGKPVRLEFNDDPEFHINLVLPEDLRESTVYEWDREGSVAFMPTRTEWPDRIYESTKVKPILPTLPDQY